MTEHSKYPPELPGEVWRGVDLLGEPIAVVLVDDTYRAMWWDAGDIRGGDRTGIWSQCADRGYMTEVLAAWALDASARCSAALAASDLGAKMAREAEGRAERAEADRADLLLAADMGTETLAKATAEMGRALARAERAETERNFYQDRERSIIEACERVADGGQYRADIVSAIQSLRERRDRAEKIAAAERRLRHEEGDGPNACAEPGCTCAASAARSALLALGVEP